MPRTMSADEYRELGRRYYKLQQYDAAVEAFTKGLAIDPSPSLYDHRAASFDRLKNFSEAVKDGREMIKLDKKDVKGYLRTASALEKMGKFDIALNIYKYGMKNVPVQDKNFKILQQMHDKISRKLSPAKSVDPLTILPVELAEMVLEYLTFRQVVNCMRVSRGWRDYLAKLPRLWLHLDLSGARKPVPRSFVDKAVRRSGNRVNRITVHRFDHVDILKNIAKMCKDLVELEIITLPHAMSETLVTIVQHAHNLKKLVVRPEITLDTTIQILSNRPTMEHIFFGAVGKSSQAPAWQGSYPHLKSFTFQLAGNARSGRMHLDDLLSRTPILQSLTLTGIRITLQSLVNLPLTTLVLRHAHTAARGLPKLPRHLKTLVVDGMTGEFIRSMPLAAYPMPQLIHLSLSDDTLSRAKMKKLLDLDIDDDAAIDARPTSLKNGQPLVSLLMRGALKDPSEGLFTNSQSLLSCSPRILTPALKTLDIQTLPCNDDEIEALLGYELALTSINISYTSITGASLKMLADKLPTLKSITANNCPKISDRDAIEYAQRKGIAVSCSMSEALGSRKVRY